MAAGLLVEEFIEQRTESSAASFVEDEVLKPLGLLDLAVIDGQRAARPEHRSRIAVPIAGLPATELPMLSERTPVHLAEIRPAFGSLFSATGLCRLYAALGQIAGGELVDGLPSPATLRVLLTSDRGRTEDRILRKLSNFSGGFMVGLSDHGFGYQLSGDAFGHVGMMGHTVGFLEPSQDIAVAFYLNGWELGGEHAEGVRSRIVDAIIADLGAA